MELNEILKDESIDTSEFYSDLFLLESRSKQNIEFPTAVVLYLLKQNQCSTKADIENILKKTLTKEEKNFIDDNLGRDMDKLLVLKDKYTNDILTKVILSPQIRYIMEYRDSSTPNSISNLAIKILNIQNNDSVADFGCGIGNFLVNAFSNNTKAKYFGNDINIENRIIAQLRCKILSKDIKIEAQNMFGEKNKKFDKIFSNYPFGVRSRDLGEGNKYIEKLKEKFPYLEGLISSDWIFNSLLIDSLSENGKAIGIMTNGSTFNSTDKSIREFFVRNGFIEALISLPDRMFPSTSIPTTLIVLSKGNKKIKFVNAQNICQQGRRNNTFSEQDIENILKLLNDNPKELSYKELGKENFVLNPTRYLIEEVKIKDSVDFGSVIKSITRGAPYTAANLDKIISKEPTNMQYLMLSNIKDGLITDNLPYLKEIDNKYKKYCIKSKNLLMSKNGKPFKIAVAEVKKGNQILANGNMYIIELDEKQVDPYFIKMFFESEIGIASLARNSVGNALPNLPLEALKKIKIPKPELKQQKAIANTYLAKIDEIKILNLRIKEIKDSLKTLYTGGIL